MNYRAAAALAMLGATATLLAACGGDDSSSSATTAGTASTAKAASVGTVTASGISADRCAENKKAGKITYLSGFDFAATPSIVDIVIAKTKGYFDKMCLDVELKPSFSTANYPQIAAGNAQFSSAGSFVELVNFAANGAELVAVVDYGKTPIDSLIVRNDIGVTKLADLKGKTIGVKGAMPPSITAMLVKAGLKQGTDWKEVVLDGFDPKIHIKQVEAFPGYKSNEPGQLAAAGIEYRLFDPSADGIPGSFGLLYTSQSFLRDHRSAAEDFVRASLKGMADAIADPDAAVKACFDLITANKNPNFLSPEGEAFRWKTERQMVLDSTPKGEPVGQIDLEQFDAQLKAYAAVKAVTGTVTPAEAADPSVVKAVVDDKGQAVWPS